MGTTAKSAGQGKVVTTTPKFQSILASSGQDVLDKRAQLTFKSTQKAMDSHLQGLNDKRDELELEKLNLIDLSVESKDSLRPTDPAFKPKEWVSRLVNLEMDIALVDDEIAIAEGIKTEFFGTGITE